MSGPANIRSFEVISDFRAALLVFCGQIEDALLSMQEQVAHAVLWFETDRPRYWKQETLTAFNQVAEARIALETNRLRKEAFGHRPSLIEEKKALEAAKKRLAYCQEKVEIVKQTSISIRHESDEFLGQLSQLQRVIESDIPKMISMLDRMLAALEAYAEHTGQAAEQKPNAS